MWTSKNDPPTSNTFNIELVYGPSGSVQSAGVLVKAPAESDLQVKVTVPATLPEGNTYALRAGNNYSPQFTITNDKVPAGSSVPPLTAQTPAGTKSGADRVSVTMVGACLSVALAMRAL
jgi:hypothetical protein